MNKYYNLLAKILAEGKLQDNKKGSIRYLLNQVVRAGETDVLRILDEHPVPRQKLKKELSLYCEGEQNVSAYSKAGIPWWQYCSPRLINSYPTYFKKLPSLIVKINTEMRSSKNYVLFIGSTLEPTNQLPCLSLMQFQIEEPAEFPLLHISVYQRSADCSLGLPCDIYQTYLISKMINADLGSITFFIGNAHIYANNLRPTRELLNGKPSRDLTFNLNV